jgi:hypothetical protein
MLVPSLSRNRAQFAKMNRLGPRRIGSGLDTWALGQGLDRVGDKFLDADHSVKGGFAAA